MDVTVLYRENSVTTPNGVLFKVSLNDKIYYALCLNDNDPIVYDEEFHKYFNEKKWRLERGYVYGPKGAMHKEVMMKDDRKPEEGYSIDHINVIPTDNRRENLRYASHSQQICNRGTRCDKHPPFNVLQEIGIKEYPRYVRWDKSENKFVIDKHPVLKKEVEKGLRNKPIISGSKSSSKTLLQKYQDIIFRLTELDERDETRAEKIEFAKNKEKLRTEYYAIATAVCQNYEKPEIKNTTLPNEVDVKRATPIGRKKQSNLPEGCGVTVDMLPKYTYYRPCIKNRGDKFVIDIRSQKYTWSTTGSMKISTKEKFKQLINHIESGLPEILNSYFH
jgi:hypothetical protein